VLFTFSKSAEQEEAARLLDDSRALSREIDEFYKFAAITGDLIDLNFDHFPRFIVATFARHGDAKRMVDRGKPS